MNNKNLKVAKQLVKLAKSLIAIEPTEKIFTFKVKTDEDRDISMMPNTPYSKGKDDYQWKLNVAIPNDIVNCMAGCRTTEDLIYNYFQKHIQCFVDALFRYCYSQFDGGIKKEEYDNNKINDFSIDFNEGAKSLVIKLDYTVFFDNSYFIKKVTFTLMDYSTINAILEKARENGFMEAK